MHISIVISIFHEKHALHAFLPRVPAVDGLDTHAIILMDDDAPDGPRQNLAGGLFGTDLQFLNTGFFAGRINFS